MSTSRRPPQHERARVEDISVAGLHSDLPAVLRTDALNLVANLPLCQIVCAPLGDDNCSLKHPITTAHNLTRCSFCFYTLRFVRCCKLLLTISGAAFVSKSVKEARKPPLVIGKREDKFKKRDASALQVEGKKGGRKRGSKMITARLPNCLEFFIE